jgi:hypothetical protein
LMRFRAVASTPLGLCTHSRQLTPPRRRASPLCRWLQTPPGRDAAPAGWSQRQLRLRPRRLARTRDTFLLQASRVRLGRQKKKYSRIFLLCTTFVRESSKSHSMGALTKPLLSTPQGRGLGLPPRGVLGLAAVCGLLLGTKLPLRLVILLFPVLPHLGLTFCWCSGGRGGAQLCRDQSCSSAG